MICIHHKNVLFLFFILDKGVIYFIIISVYIYIYFFIINAPYTVRAVTVCQHRKHSVVSMAELSQDPCIQSRVMV